MKEGYTTSITHVAWQHGLGEEEEKEEGVVGEAQKHSSQSPLSGSVVLKE